MAARGIPIRLYIDNAKMYRSPQLARIAASLGTLIIHSRPYQPEGRGKIERYFRTVREQFLANLDPKRTLSLDELNDRLQSWIDNSYHRSEHSTLGTTPLLRWQRDIEQVRQLPPATDLRRLFFHRLDRLVRRDSTFLLRGRLYEAPPHLASHTSGGALRSAGCRRGRGLVAGQIPGRRAPARCRRQRPVAFRQTADPEAPHPAPTGINFVELVHQQKDEDDEDSVPW